MELSPATVRVTQPTGPCIPWCAAEDVDLMINAIVALVAVKVAKVHPFTYEGQRGRSLREADQLDRLSLVRFAFPPEAHSSLTHSQKRARFYEP
ncbi:hypothetical protein CSOJ01_04513 [Colletotrichum sojae]|uniref:Uncharacterized protein n=1 Tax=Colletotrichum sojae TaxID=2175907 RepID=A0A8H6JI62_9PEZI|nr:hypothetical protein CSOJ01_04513 [Colletotrichum sojae]